MNKLKNMLGVYRNDGTDPRKMMRGEYFFFRLAMQEVSVKVAKERGLMEESREEV